MPSPLQLPIKTVPHFMFRETEIARLLRVLHKGQGVLLVGIRRTGKSQLMKAVLMAQRHSGEGCEAAYLDVQNLNSLANFYGLLLACMPKSVIDQLSAGLKQTGRVTDTILKYIASRSPSVSADVGDVTVSVQLKTPENLPRYWPSIVVQLEVAVQAHSSQALPVIGIDELPLLLQNLIAAKVPTADLQVLLAGLRKLRDAGLRMVIGGSVSTENLLTDLGIPHSVLGGLWREQVKPFTPAQARSYLETQLVGRPALQAIDVVLAALPDYVPEFLYIAATYLADVENARDVPWSLNNDVLRSIDTMFLQQFRERLDAHFVGPDMACAELLLDQIARHPEGGGRIDTTNLPANSSGILNRLMLDDFVYPGSDLGYAFSLNMLRLWWRAQRGMA